MSEAIEREGKAPVQGADVSRVRRVFAVVLSLAAPGAGHFLLGRFRRGAAWALGITILGLAVLSTMPVSLWTFVGALVLAFVARVAAAIDTSRLALTRSSWKTVLLGLTAFFVASAIYSALVEDPLRDYYEIHYVRAFTIPSGAMEPTLLVGDYILTDNSLYRARAPRRGDIVVFKYPGRREP